MDLNRSEISLRMREEGDGELEVQYPNTLSAFRLAKKLFRSECNSKLQLSHLY
jgi:hypothetical protein